LSSLPRLRFFDVAVVSSDFTTIFDVSFELIICAINCHVFVSVVCIEERIKQR
jgi:hypothetical protein